MHAIASDWRTAELSRADRALLQYAEELTDTPVHVGAKDIEALRAHGFDDAAIHDAAQVIAYFNYITRIAEGLGVEREDFVTAWGDLT